MLKQTIATVSVFLVAGCNPSAFSASTSPEDKLTVTMELTSLFGINTDWHRSIAISHNGELIERDLIGDTGWWRGSHLYRHVTGTYVIHEGQMGCFGFETSPLTFQTTERISCEKQTELQNTAPNASRFYQDLTYLGVFTEYPPEGAGDGFQFVPAEAAPEAELPDIL